jgi:hypothetical protein
VSAQAARTPPAPHGAPASPATARHRCPACGSAALLPFFRLDGVPVLCNVLWPTRSEAAAAPRGDQHLARCRACGMIANVAFAPDRLEYGPAYENALHFSAVFREYETALARELVARHGLRGRAVLEIGCGQGGFLRAVCAAGASGGRGFDPGYDPARSEPLPPGVVIERREFDPVALDETPALVCCRHVLEHLPRPLAMLTGLRRTLPDDAATVLYVEVPAAEWALGRLGIWDLIYEHCGHYTAGSLAGLLARAGFEPRAVRHAYGGQFLAAEASVAAPRDDRGGAAALRAAELTAGFARRHDRELRSWRAAAGRLAQRRARPVIWGAGSKGATFLDLVDRRAELFAAAVDLNPSKQGRFVSGTGHPIIGPDRLAAASPTHAIVMNPLYREEIARTLAGLGLGHVHVLPA